MNDLLGVLPGNNWPLFLLLGAVMFLSFWFKKLTLAGALTGGVIGFFVYSGAGYTGIAILGTFFILGTLATSWNLKYKVEKGFAEKNKGRRTAGQVIANGGAAGIFGLLAWYYPQQLDLFRLSLSASLASAAADTLSSELGVVYGRKFYNILTFKEDKPGLDGVISLEGTLFGLSGSLLIGVIYSVGFSWNLHLLWIVLSGTIGNLIDSLLGATLEKQRYMNNNAVNFFNTVAAAFIALLLYYVFDKWPLIL